MEIEKKNSTFCCCCKNSFFQQETIGFCGPFENRAQYLQFSNVTPRILLDTYVIQGGSRFSVLVFYTIRRQYTYYYNTSDGLYAVIIHVRNIHAHKTHAIAIDCSGASGDDDSLCVCVL